MKREHTYHALREKFLLNRAWRTLFGPPEEQSDFEIDRELHHPKIALGAIVAGCMDDAKEAVNAQIAQAQAEGASPERLFQIATNMLINYGTATAMRMFRVGQYVADNVPYDNMAGCPCEILFDEDAERLLSEPLAVEGEGWVIKHFGKTGLEI